VRLAIPANEGRAEIKQPTRQRHQLGLPVSSAEKKIKHLKRILNLLQDVNIFILLFQKLLALLKNLIRFPLNCTKRNSNQMV